MKNTAEEYTNNLKVSNEVICKIVEVAVKSVDGVAGINDSRINFVNMLTKSEPASSVKIESENGSIDISVSIVLSYDFKVKQVTEAVQNKVKADVQNMTGIPVTKVNVTVSDIAFDNN